MEPGVFNATRARRDAESFRENRVVADVPRGIAPFARIQAPEDRLRDLPLPTLPWAGAVSMETTSNGSTMLVVSSSDTTTIRPRYDDFPRRQNPGAEHVAIVRQPNGG